MKLKTKVWALLVCLMLSFLTACTSEEVYEAAGIALEVADALLQDGETAQAEQNTAFDAALQEKKQDNADYRAETPETEFENLDLLEEDGQDADAEPVDEPENLLEQAKEVKISEDGIYTSKEDVALYIHLYDHLPDNYITKKEARNLGWESSEGNLWDVAPGKSIGGDYFGNYEGLLPEEDGRDYYECDIDYEGGYRNSKRIIFSDDGLIFYTEDHYESFEQLYD